MSAALRTYYRGATLVGMRDEVAQRTSYYHFDPQGTTQCLTDENGAVTDRFACDAWGVPVKRTGSSINRQWYIGNLGYYRARDRALDYVRARYYSFLAGRWLARDSQGLSRWDANLYQYVRNLVSVYFDPTGHECDCCPGQIAADQQGSASHCAGGVWEECSGVDTAKEDCRNRGQCAMILDALIGIAQTCGRMCDGCSKGGGGYRPNDPWDALTVCCYGAEAYVKCFPQPKPK